MIKKSYPEGLENKDEEIFQVVQWLRLPTPNERGLGSTPGQGARSHSLQLKDAACYN